MQIKKPAVEIVSRVMIFTLLLSVVRQFLSFYQTESQLISPLIPESTFAEITRPFIFMALIGTVGAILCLIFYFYRQYWISIILAGVVLVWEIIYPYYYTPG